LDYSFSILSSCSKQAFINELIHRPSFCSTIVQSWTVIKFEDYGLKKPVVTHFEMKNNVMANNKKNIAKSIHEMRVGTCCSVVISLLAENIAPDAKYIATTTNPIIIKIISSPH
jgi:hypothetical protein